MTDNSPDLSDPWLARFYRKPLGPGSIDLICIILPGCTVPAETSSVFDTIRRKGRAGKTITVQWDTQKNFGNELNEAIETITSNIVIITTSSAQWNRDIIDRLLKELDEADIVIGARKPVSFRQKISRIIRSKMLGFFWGAGVLDPHSPYKIFRADLLKKIPLQSRSRFVEIELIAKANFLEAIIKEEELPVSPAWEKTALGSEAYADKNSLFRKPQFQKQIDIDCRNESIENPHLF